MTGKPKIPTSRRQVLPVIDLRQTRFHIDCPMLASKMFTITFSFLKLKMMSDVFVFTKTQHCPVGLMSNRCQSSACIPAADENWQI